MQCRKCAWIAGFPHHVPVGTGTNQITASLYNIPTLVSCVLYTAYTIIYISFLLSFWNSLKCQILPFAKKYMHLYLLITKCASIIFFCNLGTCKALQLRSVNHGCNALASADYISSCRSAPKVQNFSYGAGEENQSTRSAETLLLRLCSINTSPSAVVADETCHSFIHKLL